MRRPPPIHQAIQKILSSIPAPVVPIQGPRPQNYNVMPGVPVQGFLPPAAIINQTEEPQLMHLNPVMPNNAAAPAIVAPPAFSVDAVVTGLAPTGSTLTCDGGTATGGAPIARSYQWKSNSTNVGSDQNTYVTVAGDFTKTITCVVTATNSAGTATSTSNGIVVTSAPINTVAPAITGSTPIGSTLTAPTGTWIGTATITYAYQWKSNSTNVGSNQNTYVTVTGDATHAMTCVVTATNGIGSTAATSNAITVDAAPVFGVWDSTLTFSGAYSYSNSDRTLTTSGSRKCARSTVGVNTGVRGFEILFADHWGNSSYGVVRDDATLTAGAPGFTAAVGNSVGCYQHAMFINGSSNGFSDCGETDLVPIGFIVDFVLGRAQIHGTLTNVSGWFNLPTGWAAHLWYPSAGYIDAGASAITINHGETAFSSAFQTLLTSLSATGWSA